jgi:protein-disulfide isomerase
MRRVIFGVLLLVLPACGGTQTSAQSGGSASASQGQDAVVAELGGRRITMKELDERWQAVDPAERARVTQLLYQNRRNVLEQMIGDLLIAEAAKSAGMSEEQYLEQETAKRARPVTEAEVRTFYDDNKDRAQGRTFEQLQEQIREFLQSQRRLQARAQLVDDLMNERDDVRVLLDPPRQEVRLTDHDPASGPANAPVTIIEFSDYQCPYCARVVPTLKKLQAEYGDKIRIVFKDFPLPNHPQAPKAAEAAHCAGEQGKYWEMHDRMFANQGALLVPQLKETAAALGLDSAKFDQCLDSGKYAAIVQEDLEYGSDLGVSSTPSLYVNGRPVIGAQPYDVFKRVIDEELARSR